MITIKSKKIIIINIIIYIFILLNLSGCQDNSRIDEYFSPYTSFYKNDDGTYTMYIYSSVKNVLDSNGKYEIINNNIRKIKNNDKYSYENKNGYIKTLFPKNSNDYIKMDKENNIIEIKLINDEFVDNFSHLKIIENIFGDDFETITYGLNNDISMQCHPTNTGIYTEITINKPISKIEFSIKTNNLKIEDKNNGYLMLTKDNEILGIIQSSFIAFENNLYINDKIEYSYNHEYNSNIVTIDLNNIFLNNNDIVYPIKISTTFDFYFSSLPDSTIYSFKNDNNFYLSNFFIIGHEEKYGIGKHYSRLRLYSIAKINPKDILSAKLYIRELSGSNENEISIFKMNNFWSSSRLTWNKRNNTYEDLLANKEVVKGKYNEFELTNYIKKCFSDSTCETESNGILIMGSELNNNKYNIFASSDNSLYSPYIIINLKNLPKEFLPFENIF